MELPKDTPEAIQIACLPRSYWDTPEAKKIAAEQQARVPKPHEAEVIQLRS